MALVRRPSGCPSSLPGLGALHLLFFVLFLPLGQRTVRHGEQVVLHGQKRIGSVFQLLPIDAVDDFGVELVGFLPQLLQEAARLLGDVDTFYAAVDGVCLHRSGRAVEAVQENTYPPRTKIEETVLDLTQTAKSFDDVCGWVTRAIARDLTD